MKHEDELPEAVRGAFESYPRIEPSAAFNRAVLESLSSAQAKRRRGFVGQIEEFLGVGLWSFAASGAMGAFVPAVILSTLLLSGHTRPQQSTPSHHHSTTWPGFSPFGEVYRREHEFI